ncbi:MAG: ferrous iron transport protein B [Desulfovibrio sp.]|jgi:ferrous iron transport protein B|nr:ferrous iron transport protein B [Desulfovibrio sp.]
MSEVNENKKHQWRPSYSCCGSCGADKAVENRVSSAQDLGVPVARIALAGNPNSGKTTVFNRYTGARQHVGNYPGVTVEKKEGSVVCRGRLTTIVDLPGTYSLTAYSQEELVARQELSSGNVQAVIDIVEASALDRNMLLPVQLLEMGIPVVVGCNMMDEAHKAGINVDTERLSALIGAPVVPMVGRNGEGLDEALAAALALADGGYREPLRISYGPDLDDVLAKMENLIADRDILTDRYHPRWTAVKIIENDEEIRREAAQEDEETTSRLMDLREKTASHVTDTLKADLEGLVTDYRYGYVRSLLRDGIVRRESGKDRLAVTDKLDRALTDIFFGPLIMLGVLFLVFQFTFTVGAFPQTWIEDDFAALGTFLGDILPDGLVKSLVVDGIIGGVGGVISFVPLILIMFAFISLMEDSGYMARVAYMLDRIFRFFGLHGASAMPYIISGGISGGCAIPGVMSTRTMRGPKEKLATLLTLPYMTCGAKLPVILLLAGTFFPDSEALVMFFIMVAGWLTALCVARFLRSTIVKGKATPFVMELPPYRMPTLLGVLQHCWERAWMYLKKAGTVLVAISVLIWASMTFPYLPEEKITHHEQKVERLEEKISQLSEDHPGRAALEEELAQDKAETAEAKLAYSLAGRLGKWLEPFTGPAGFDWRTDIALIAGIAAKEAVVGTLGTAYSLGDVDTDDAAPLAARLKTDPGWSKATAIALMLFVLLYSPCFVALVIIRQEAGSWAWVAFSMVFNTALAYCVATVAYQAGRIF